MYLPLFRTISTYKCSRQTLYEKLGKTSRTVDSELETQIESLRDTQRKYANILKLARALTSHFYHVVHTQVRKQNGIRARQSKSPSVMMMSRKKLRTYNISANPYIDMNNNDHYLTFMFNVTFFGGNRTLLRN